ncbi:MAG TPA: STT3 domain-containing protein [Thermoanaerobaculia bacterium]|nr:STT3 domain-containing protein [Thermoanaerobaculia bacterium]
MRRVLLVAIIVALALALRISHRRQATEPLLAFPPYDDLYHAKRIAWTAAHFPHALEYDDDRRAWCPWPPLYDLACAAGARLAGAATDAEVYETVAWFPPIGFAVFAGVVAMAVGWRSRAGAIAGTTAGATLAISPYLITTSEIGSIDHHWTEPALMLAIVAATVHAYRSGSRAEAWQRGAILGAVIVIAMFVQPAFLAAAALAFTSLFCLGEAKAETRQAPLIAGTGAFAIAAVACVLYRTTRPPGYPDSAWFLGWTHVAIFAGAAVACGICASFESRKRWQTRGIALIAGALAALSFPRALDALPDGIRFFRGDPWLATIIEFQPMLRDPSRLGTDLANLTGGAALAFVLAWQAWRHRTRRILALFAIAYFVLALSSRRFLVPGIALFAVSGATVACDFVNNRRRTLGALAMAATLLPPLCYDIHAIARPEPQPASDEVDLVRAALALRSLPPGRVLAPWSYGHAIDVIGRHGVALDNFGSMPDSAGFRRNIEALLSSDEDALASYCHDQSIRFLVLPDPTIRLGAMSATIGIPNAVYAPSSRRAQSTVWWRAYKGRGLTRFSLVMRGNVQVWTNQ